MTTLYIVQLSGQGEKFIKIGIDDFLSILLESFESYGYKYLLIKTYKFANLQGAKKSLQNFCKKYESAKWKPMHEFLERENCYNIKVLNGFEIPINSNNLEVEERELQKIAPAKELQILQMLKSKKPGEVAKDFGIPGYKVSRIKKKYGTK